MPVWIKFRDLELSEKSENYKDEHYEIIGGLQDAFIFCKQPSDFFPQLVEAVKWYNQTQKK